MFWLEFWIVWVLWMGMLTVDGQTGSGKTYSMVSPSPSPPPAHLHLIPPSSPPSMISRHPHLRRFNIPDFEYPSLLSSPHFSTFAFSDTTHIRWAHLLPQVSFPASHPISSLKSKISPPQQIPAQSTSLISKSTMNR